MKNNYITLDYRHFEDLKNKVKFIEFYWMCYKSQHPKMDYNKEILSQIELIEEFIYLNRYKDIKKVSQNFFSTKVRLKKINYNQLNKYVELSNLLKNSIKYIDWMKIEVFKILEYFHKNIFLVLKY